MRARKLARINIQKNYSKLHFHLIDIVRMLFTALYIMKSFYKDFRKYTGFLLKEKSEIKIYCNTAIGIAKNIMFKY